MENEVLKAIKERRSCRKFKAELPADELIDQVVEAGLWAASGKGVQCPIILKVTDPEVREQFRAANTSIMGTPEDFDPFYGAPAILVVLAPKDNFTYIYDGSLCMGNMMLAAHALGLGSIWIHRAKEEFQQPAFKELLAKLGVEGEYEGIGHCALGYSDNGEAPCKPRNEGRVLSL